MEHCGDFGILLPLKILREINVASSRVPKKANLTVFEALNLSKVISRKFQVSEKILNFLFYTYFLTEYLAKVGNTEVTNQSTTVHTVPQVYSFLSKIQGAQILISMTFKPSKMSKF